MATSAKCLARQARHLSQRPQWISSRQTWHATVCRPFSHSTIHRADNESGPTEADSNAPYYNGKFFNQLDRNDQVLYNTLSSEDRQKMETVKRQLDDEFAFDSGRSKELDRMIQRYTEDVEEKYPDLPAQREPRNRSGFFNMSEREDLGPDEEFQDDDITSDAHRELEQHREIREYARLAAWEMPLLADLARPFEPPTQAVPLRFRYTTYLGEQHPASRKVVVEFEPHNLNLSKQEMNKLIKLAGPRFSPETGLVKMSCESFETQAQNKRYLGDTIQNLIVEAKDTTDTFQDVPFDFRHVKQKKKFRYPVEWHLNPERQSLLESIRAQTQIEDHQRRDQGKLVSGLQAIEEGRKLDLQQEKPLMIEANARLAVGKQGQKQMGQKGR